MNDLVVVGGGVLGTMHALSALERGWSVTHLERDPAPRGASVRHFGLVWVSGRAVGRELALALAARERWEEIGARVPGDRLPRQRVADGGADARGGVGAR